MQQSSLHSAKELSLPVRNALEQLLGRPLSDNEAISVRAYQPHEAPTAQQQRAVADDLRQYFARIDQKSKNISEGDREEIIEEAIRSVSPVTGPLPGESHSRLDDPGPGKLTGHALRFLTAGIDWSSSHRCWKKSSRFFTTNDSSNGSI